MPVYHVLAAIGDFADDHRSLGVFEAASAREALVHCLHEYDQDPKFEGVPADVAAVGLADHRRLRRQLHEVGAYFVVCPVEAEAHFLRDHDGEVRDAGEVERRRRMISRDFGLDWN